MSRGQTLASLLRAVRRRHRIIVVGIVLPCAAAVIGIAWRLFGGKAAVLTALLVGVAMAVLATVRSRRFDSGWVTRALDARVPELEDSSALLARPTQLLSGLEALQQQRLSARIARLELPDLRPAWPWAALALAWALGGALLALAITNRLPGSDDAVVPVRSSAVPAAPASAAQITQARLTVYSPPYTALPARVVAGLSTRAPAGSMLQWSLHVSPAPGEMLLTTLDDKRVPLTLTNGSWQARTVLTSSILYRVVASDLPALDPRLHRIDAMPDRAPRVRVLSPSRTLNIATPDQRELRVAFEADDDYGVAGARLVVTLAQGSGENIGVRSLEFPAAGTGPPKRRRFSRSLDLAALGMQPGDDLIAQLHVEDNRAPRAQRARSASVILRWPLLASAESSGMEGLVQRVLPAYFRSQRQIIIDSEALLKERSTLTAERFVQRSDAIGVDQRVLRLRYGQFLGEEAESGSRPPVDQPERASADASTAASPPVAASIFADAHAHVEIGPESKAGEGDAIAATQPEHADEHSGAGDAAAFGNAGAVTAEFGHTHDIAEAATLLDPATQKLLRAALGAMWQAELHLRQGFPDRALPYENRALDLIKQVQQADRIYLAKVGLEIPPVDEARRLTGKRDGLRDRPDVLSKAPIKREALLALWIELGRDRADAHARNASLKSPLADAERWLLSQEQTTGALDAVAAIDAVRLDEGCQPCRQRLRASLWPLLPRPAANVRRRSVDGAIERAYLDALARERQP